jgi:hypothetical protein
MGREHGGRFLRGDSVKNCKPLATSCHPGNWIELGLGGAALLFVESFRCHPQMQVQESNYNEEASLCGAFNCDEGVEEELVGIPILEPEWRFGEIFVSHFTMQLLDLS